MYREQYTPHVLYILPTGAGYTAYISSEKKLHSAVSLTRFLPQKKKVCTAYTGYMIPSTYCSSISQHFAWPGGKFSMLNWQVPSLVVHFLGPNVLLSSPVGAQLLCVSTGWGFPQGLRELGIVRIGTKPSLLFFCNSHPEGVEGLVTYRDFSLDGKAQTCMCYVWLTEHSFGEVSCSRVIILWWMLSVQLMWISGRKLMLKTQHRCAFWYNFGACPQSLR